MFTPAPLELLNLVVFKEKSEDVVSRLLTLGVFHPVDIRHIEENLQSLTAFDTKKEYAEWDELDLQATIIAGKLNFSLYTQQITEKRSQSDLQKKLSVLEEKINPLFSAKEKLLEEIKTKSALVDQINDYLLFPIGRSVAYSFLDVSLGRLEEKRFPILEKGLEHTPHITYPLSRDGNYIAALVLGLRRDKPAIDEALREAGWQKIELPYNTQGLSKGVEKKILAEIEELKKKVEHADDDLRKLAEVVKDDLIQINSHIVLNKSILEAKKYFCSTEKTSLLSGWVPREEKEKILRQIKESAGVSVIEVKKPEEVDVAREEIPVRLRHTPFVRPFELLITSYGLPRYGSIDPTVFVAMTFLIMFGVMFGDLGHGLVLVCAGLFLFRSKKDIIRQAAALVLYSGMSSCLFGALEGSFFGFEFRSLVTKPMENIMGLFKLSIMFGIGVITAGILFNIINAFRDKDYVKAFLDKAGLIGGMVYWVSIGLVSKSFIAHTGVHPAYLYLLFAGILLLFLKPFLETVFKRGHGKNIFESLMEGMIELLDIFMGFLANTVSFIRIGAFALAHMGLFLAIFGLAQMVKNAGNGLVSAAVFIGGNILVILLEGMVVGIQSLRLNYYEFFSKFFLAGKRLYKPMSL